MAGVLRQPLLAPGAAVFACGACRTAGRLPASSGLLPLPLPLLLLQQQQQRRTAATSYRRPSRSRSGANADTSPSVGMAQVKGARPSAMISFRIPQTFVPPDWSSYLTQPAVLAKLLWYRLRSRVTDKLAEVSVRLQSKEGFFKAGRYKPGTKALGPTAQSMHYQMLEATAAGDLAALRRLLTQSHLDEVAGLVARRPRGQRCRWELLAYKGRPRVVDNKVVLIPGPVPMLIRQAVVTIRSRQRFTWTSEGGGGGGGGAAPPPPTVVEKDVKENVVLVATLDRTTWQTAEWRIFGFLPDTTLESWEREKQLVMESSQDGATSVDIVERR